MGFIRLVRKGAQREAGFRKRQDLGAGKDKIIVRSPRLSTRGGSRKKKVSQFQRLSEMKKKTY